MTMQFKSIQQWINEQNQAEEPLYGCVMMEPKKIKDWEVVHLAGIDEEDVYVKHTTNPMALKKNHTLRFFSGYTKMKWIHPLWSI